MIVAERQRQTKPDEATADQTARQPPVRTSAATEASRQSPTSARIADTTALNLAPPPEVTETARDTNEPPPHNGASPFYKRVWFWAVVSAVAGRTAAAFAISRDPTRVPKQPLGTQRAFRE